jgi:hypothetical protein
MGLDATGLDGLGNGSSDLTVDALAWARPRSQPLRLEQGLVIGLEAGGLRPRHQCQDLLAQAQEVVGLDVEVGALQRLDGDIEGGKPKLTSHQKRSARNRLANGESTRDVAKDFAVHHATIARLR